MPKVVVIGDVRVDGPRVSVDPGIRASCRGADLVIANLEGPIVKHAHPRVEKRSPLKSKPIVIDLLHELNVSVVTIANNHICDFGEDGLMETIDILEAAGIRWVGAGIENGPARVLLDLPEIDGALAAFAHREGPVREVNGQGSGPYALPGASLLELIKGWRLQRRRVLVSYHGGEEYFTVPWPRRAAWAASLVEAGASLVFGHHSHSIQPVTRHSSGVIIHGTGNFFFETPGQRRHYGTSEGIITSIFWGGSGDPEIHVGRVCACWDKPEVRLIEPLGPLHSYPDEDELLNSWKHQCRKRVWGDTMALRPKNGDWWRRYARSALFVWRNLRNGFSSIRDKDIILSALPFVDNWNCKNLKKDAKNFRY